MDKPFQRKGAESNTEVGRDFEAKAQIFFTQVGLDLIPGIAVEIGINGISHTTLTLEMSKRRLSLNARPTRGLKEEMFQAQR